MTAIFPLSSLRAPAAALGQLDFNQQQPGIFKPISSTFDRHFSHSQSIHVRCYVYTQNNKCVWIVKVWRISLTYNFAAFFSSLFVCVCAKHEYFGIESILSKDAINLRWEKYYLYEFFIQRTHIACRGISSRRTQCVVNTIHTERCWPSNRNWFRFFIYYYQNTERE